MHRCRHYRDHVRARVIVPQGRLFGQSGLRYDLSTTGKVLQMDFRHFTGFLMIVGFAVMAGGWILAMIPDHQPAFGNKGYPEIIVEIPDAKNAVQSGQFLIGCHTAEGVRPLIFDRTKTSQDREINAADRR